MHAEFKTFRENNPALTLREAIGAYALKLAVEQLRTLPGLGYVSDRKTFLRDLQADDRRPAGIAVALIAHRLVTGMPETLKEAGFLERTHEHEDDIVGREVFEDGTVGPWRPMRIDPVELSKDFSERFKAFLRCPESLAIDAFPLVEIPESAGRTAIVGALRLMGMKHSEIEDAMQALWTVDPVKRLKAISFGQDGKIRVHDWTIRNLLKLAGWHPAVKSEAIPEQTVQIPVDQALEAREVREAIEKRRVLETRSKALAIIRENHVALMEGRITITALSAQTGIDKGALCRARDEELAEIRKALSHTG